MLHRLTFLFILASTPLAGCNAAEHCIGDCEPQSTSSDTAGPSPSSTSSTADGGTTTADAPTTAADAPTTGNTTTAADDLTTTGADDLTTTAADDLTTTGAEGHASCRDGLTCTIYCMIQVPDPIPPDYPLDECLTMCLEDMSNAELLKLHDLQECAETKCGATAEWKCVDGTDDCLGCFLQTLGNTMLPAGDECEAQSKACD
ncbi:hypothetical protein [Nannocystis sp. SCPEA4]|uniref:hypothetical protein n=1 Tax=Nannocystis sp. SCPEA4 TaxID=2996787 RepID=UPI00226DB3CF|nr:hypothetical protein [Nannocystis sp. SCPEA4]MCY1055505.1 hypothetical protein [Nannocystis sp. SCPEA4]